MENFLKTFEEFVIRLKATGTPYYFVMMGIGVGLIFICLLWGAKTKSFLMRIVCFGAALGILFAVVKMALIG